MTDEKKDMSADKAKKVLERDIADRVSACQKDLNDVLQKHNCVLDVSMVLRAGVAPMAQLSIQAKS